MPHAPHCYLRFVDSKNRSLAARTSSAFAVVGAATSLWLGGSSPPGATWLRVDPALSSTPAAPWEALLAGVASLPPHVPAPYVCALPLVPLPLPPPPALPLAPRPPLPPRRRPRRTRRRKGTRRRKRPERR